MTKDEALKKAGDILIGAFSDVYGSITFNLQGKRTQVFANIVDKRAVVTNTGVEVPVDIKLCKQL